MKDTTSNFVSDKKKYIKNVLGIDIFIVSLIAVVSNFPEYMIEPTLALYALSLGSSMTFIGVLSSTTYIFQTLTSIPVGRLSDKWGRKPFFILWSVTASSVPTMFAAAKTFWHLLPARIIWGLGFSANQVSFRSYITDNTKPERLHVAMGIYYVTMGFGVVLGPLLSGRLVTQLGFVNTYLIASLIGSFSILFVFLGIKNNPLNTNVNNNSQSNLTENLKSVIFNSAIFSVILLTSLNMLGHKVVFDYVPAYLSSLGANTITIGDLFVIRGLFTVAIRLPIGAAANRLGTWNMMIFALFLQSLAIFLFPYSTRLLSQSVLMAFIGLGFGIFLISSAIHMMRIAPSQSRGITLGVMATVVGTLNAFYGPIRGYIADLFGISSAFMIMGIFIASFTLAIIVSNKLRNNNS